MTSLTDDLKLQPMGMPYMLPAWLGCVHWAIGDDSIRKLFKEDTGYDVTSLVGRSPIEEMVDQATGRDREVLIRFCDWVTENIWGIEGVEYNEQD